jgi:hypothetical protein
LANNKDPTSVLQMKGISEAAGPGFEPGLSDSESVLFKTYDAGSLAKE